MNKIVPNEKVHPVAALFPMMSDEELDELAADIKENGLLNPIVLDESGVLIDGRNRSAACAIAGVNPFYEQLNGTDPISFIMSSNDKRRHMTKGQRAMIAAKIRALSQTTTRELSKSTSVDLGQIGKACVVLEYRPDLAESVIAGMPLNEAYEAAKKCKSEASTIEAKLKKLEKVAPDLAEQVSAETLSLEEALAASIARDKEEQKRAESKRQEREIATNQLQKILLFADPNAKTPKEKADAWIALIDPEFIQEEIRTEQIEQSAEVLKYLAKAWSKSYGQVQSKS